MITVPLPARAGSTDAEAQRLRDALLYEERMEVQMHAWRGRLWARVCAQVYVEATDVERLAESVRKRGGAENARPADAACRAPRRAGMMRGHELHPHAPRGAFARATRRFSGSAAHSRPRRSRACVGDLDADVEARDSRGARPEEGGGRKGHDGRSRRRAQ